MRARDQVDLNWVESPDALEFTVTRERGWFTRLFFPIFALAILFWLWGLGSIPLRIMAAVAAVSTAITLIANWMHGNDTTLRVTADEIVVRGNLNSSFRHEVRFDAKQLKSLRWESGGDADSGLYARWPWNCRCILTEISAEQAARIRDAIAGKFPEIQIGDSTPASLLFGNDSGVTELGLSDADSNAPKGKD